ncbi:MAG: polysaccharide export protein [Acidobacteriia bacterium]|jgi:polysaccharide export outer membrane protein|nr:polysaccharide export protein [Terriglobia bacterium]
MRIRTLLLVLLLTVAPLPAQQTSNRTRAESPGNGNGARMSAPGPSADYRIGPQDVLTISVWKEPEITRTVPVRPDGKISLPLLNDVQAAGLTPMELAESITLGLKKFIADPQVTVIVTEINSRHFYVLGEVSRPGAYPLLPGMTVLQALSGAGGFSQWANLNEIYVLRNEGGQQVRYPFKYKDVLKGKRTEQNIELKPGDTIVVP